MDEVSNLREAVKTWRNLYQETKQDLERAKRQISQLQQDSMDPEVKRMNVDFESLRAVIERSRENMNVLTNLDGNKAFRYCPMTWPKFIDMLEKDYVFRKIVERETGYLMEVERIKTSGRVLITGRYEE